MAKIELNTDLEEGEVIEDKVEVEEFVPKPKPKPKKVDWSAFIDKELPNWNPKFRGGALAYLNEKNPKSVTLTDKPTKNLKDVVIVGFKEGVLDFISELENKNYEKVLSKSFKTIRGNKIGVFSILEVKIDG